MFIPSLIHFLVFPLFRINFFLFVLPLFSLPYHLLFIVHIQPFSASSTKHPIIFLHISVSFFQTFSFFNLVLILKCASSFLKFLSLPLSILLYLSICRYNSSLTIMSANTMTKRVSSVKRSPTPSKNLRTSWEEELRLYISFDELKSMGGENGAGCDHRVLEARRDEAERTG